eukprot:TRINITY_DN79838_c0_g1_i1.p1 TRINITY_DN79838_c0_g1~~TRINITY_DN79838_c0_g1_i1.p1  ORF type:complete len:371 (-),score=55.21 TRINITY_DN79838_c0_g1_i1:135-1247(-)
MPVPRDDTGIMLKGVDRQLTVDVLQSLLHGMGLRYDFLYLPWAGKRNSNIGLAFINFLDATSATRCIQEFTALKSQHGVAKLFKSISKSYVHGFEQNLAFYLVSCGVEAIEDDHKPLVFDKFGQPLSLRWAVAQFVTMDLLTEVGELWRLTHREKRHEGMSMATTKFSDCSWHGEGGVDKLYPTDKDNKDMREDLRGTESRRSSRDGGIPAKLPGTWCQVPQEAQDSREMRWQAVPSPCLADCVAKPGPCSVLPMWNSCDLSASRPALSATSSDSHGLSASRFASSASSPDSSDLSTRLSLDSSDLSASRPAFSASSPAQCHCNVPFWPAGVKRGDKGPHMDGQQTSACNAKAKLSTVRVGDQEITLIAM